MASIDDLDEIFKDFGDETGAAAESIGKLKDAVDDSLPSFEDASDEVTAFGVTLTGAKKGVKGLGDESTFWGKRFKAVSSSLSGAQDGIKSFIDATDSGVESLKKMVDSAGTGISSIANGMLPVIGPMIGSVVTAFTMLTGAALGFASGLIDTNRQLSNIGVMFEDDNFAGIEAFTSEVAGSGIKISQAMSTLTDNLDLFRLAEGGVVAGFKKTMGAFKILDNSSNHLIDSFRNMGYSTEDILSTYAEVDGRMTLMGKSLNVDELNEATKKYLIQQADLRKITGEDIKTLKSKRDAMQTQTEWQAYTRTLKDGGEKITRFANIFDSMPDVQQIFMKKLMGVQLNVDQQTLYNVLGSSVQNSIASLANTVNSGSELTDSALRQFATDISSAANKNLVSMQKEMGASNIGNIVNFTSNAFSNAMTAAGNLTIKFSELDKQLTNFHSLQDILDSNKLQGGNLNTAMASLERASLAIEAASLTFVTLISKVFAPAVSMGANLVDKYSKNAMSIDAKWTKAMDSYQAVMNNASIADEDKAKKIAEILDGIVPKDSIFDGLADKIADVFAEGLDTAFGQILPLYTSKKERMENIKNLKTGETAMSKKDLAILDKLSLEKLDELGMKKIENDVLRWFGTHYYKKVEREINRPDDFRQSPTEIPKNNAYGSILEPKQGGHIIRVAEAGSPEIVAPANKDPVTGKLGLTVSGAMFDDSVILKNTLQETKTSNNLLFSLISKMAALNDSLERLVNEQKTANRLAT